MITSKIKTRHWVLFILLMVALVLSLVALALSMGEQYHVVAEEFQSVFRLSILVSIILLIIGIKCFGRWRRREKGKNIEFDLEQIYNMNETMFTKEKLLEKLYD